MICVSVFWNFGPEWRYGMRFSNFIFIKMYAMFYLEHTLYDMVFATFILKNLSIF